MFPSSGYFRGVPCPFYANGLCERPYCHFRHSKTESDRLAKTESGPSYSTSSTPSYQSNSLLNGVPLSSNWNANAELSPGVARYSAATSVPPQGPVEAYKSSSDKTKSNASETIDTDPQNFHIPSFSPTAHVLPESDNEPEVNIESLPKISGLPKTRTSLPSYVPTPKVYDKPATKGSVPQYTPTPKSSHIIEYDPVKNFASLCDKQKSVEEEAAFSDEDDEIPSTSNCNQESFKSTEENEEAKSTRSAAPAEDDLTDSDEDVPYPISGTDASAVENESSKYADLLTPSSFFTEKLALASSSNKDAIDSNSSSNKSKICPLQLNDEKCDTSTINSQSSSSRKYHKSKGLNSMKAGSSTATSLPHRSSTSSTSSSSSSDKKKSSTSSNSMKILESSSSSFNKDSKCLKSSSSRKDSGNLKSISSSSVSKKEHKSLSSCRKASSTSEKNSSNHSKTTKHYSEKTTKEKTFSPSITSTTDKSHSSTSSSSSKDAKHDLSFSHKHSNGVKLSSSSPALLKKEHRSLSSPHKSSSSSDKESSGKNHSTSKHSLKKLSKEKSPVTRPSAVSEKRDGLSSEKENKHSSSHHVLGKSQGLPGSSVASSSSSSSSSNLSGHHKHSRLGQSESVDEKVDKKPSVIAKENSLFKHKTKPHNLKTSEIYHVKRELKKNNLNINSANASSKLTNSKLDMAVIKESKQMNSGSFKRDKVSSNKFSRVGENRFDSDSDVEIIEPPPAPVYNISDSDDNGRDDCHVKEHNEKSSEEEFSVDDVDLMSDGDTFDECLRIFQESEYQMAEKLKKDGKKLCPEKRKEHEEPAKFESSDDLLTSIGKKRMAYPNSSKVSRPQKAPAARLRLSPAQVMHNRIIEMQKRALLRAARREGRESDLKIQPQQIETYIETDLSRLNFLKPPVLAKNELTSAGKISVMGGGLPSALPPSVTSGSNKTVSLSPSLLPQKGQSQRQAHTPSTSFMASRETPPHKSTPTCSNRNEMNRPVPSSSSPSTFYAKKKLLTTAPKNTTTIAGTASKTEKRKAHEPNLSNLKRPLIPAEFGSKVPTNVRQRYLNLIIDEHLKFRPENEAFVKGEEDEKAVYEKATNKNIYLRVAVNAIKRIRTDAANALPSASKRPCLEGAGAQRLNSMSGHMAQSHAATLRGPKAVQHSYTLNRSRTAGGSAHVQIEGKEFYDRLKKYILTESQLRENGYPRPSEDGSLKVQFYKEDVAGVLLKDNERVCRRCGTRFNVTKDGEPISNGLCVYHYGSAYKKRVSGAIESRYSCCSERAGTKGCQVATCHVHERNKADNRTGYMKTMPASSASEKNFIIFSLDCEMVYTKAGLELARVTVIGEDCQVVYETLVKPDTDVIDYNTRFSGITAADMKGVTTDIRGVQAVMLSMISDKTILMGHSLESDLIALKLIHSTVVDTSLVFPHRLGLPYKRALRNLMLDHLKKIIQADDRGHDSKEDAVACMQLMVYKVKEDAKRELRRN